jgi:hypothetical protein
MSRNGSGTYSIINTFVSGNSITAAGHNQNMSDIATEITNSVAADGQTTMTGPLKAANGTVAAPAVSFSSYLDTGMYRIGANNVGIAAGGTKIVDVSATAVGITGDSSVSGTATIGTVAATTLTATTATVNGVLTCNTTANMVLPNGTTAQRPGSPATAMLRYNSTLVSPEYYTGSAWVQISQPITQPHGRLTPTTGTPVLTTDATAQATIYYTPYTGNLVPIYDGAAFTMQAFSELSMAMGGNYAADSIYDCFVFNDSGTLRLGIGPAWTTSTAGSGARGTGAGTTELQRINGLWTNKVSMTARYANASTVTVAANCGTYVGSIYTDHTAGQVSCHFAYGQNRKFGVWNAYNRVPIMLKAGDGTASWTYGTATWRASNNAPASFATGSYNVGSGTVSNGILIFTGLAEEDALAQFTQKYSTNTTNVAAKGFGIGLNSTSAQSGLYVQGSATNGVQQSVGPATLTIAPNLGLNVVTSVENITASGDTTTILGTEAHALLTAIYRG